MQDSAESINCELLKLYQSKEEIFSQIYQRKDVLNLNLMLPYVCKNFVESKAKLMVIGQETYGWVFEGNREKTMEHTMEFLSHNKDKNSYFWYFIKQFYETLGEELGNDFTPIVWNNVRKVCFNLPKHKGKPKPKDPLPQELQEFIDNNLGNLLFEEIKIIQPKIALFLTGPNFEKYIKPQLHGIEHHSIKDFLALNPTLKQEEFPLPNKLKKVKVLTHKDLPNTLMLRIYHPTYYHYQLEKNRSQYFESLTKLCKKWLDIHS